MFLQGEALERLHGGGALAALFLAHAAQGDLACRIGGILPVGFFALLVRLHCLVALYAPGELAVARDLDDGQAAALAMVFNLEGRVRVVAGQVLLDYLVARGAALEEAGIPFDGVRAQEQGAVAGTPSPRKVPVSASAAMVDCAVSSDTATRRRPTCMRRFRSSG